MAEVVQYEGEHKYSPGSSDRRLANAMRPALADQIARRPVRNERKGQTALGRKLPQTTFCKVDFG